MTDEKGEEVQVFTKEQAAEIFDVTQVTPTGPSLICKLEWLNGEHIRRMSVPDLGKIAAQAARGCWIHG